MTGTFDILVAKYGYWVITFAALIEGESFLIAGGVAAHKGLLSLPIMIVLAVVGSLLHDHLFFFLGRYAGKPFIEKRPWLHKKLGKALDLLARYGLWMIIGFRFAYGLRTIIPTAVGMSRIEAWRFFLYDLLGGVIWAITFLCGGYLFGNVLSQALLKIEMYGAVGWTVMGVVIVICVLGYGFWFWRRRAKRQCQEDANDKGDGQEQVRELES